MTATLAPRLVPATATLSERIRAIVRAYPFVSYLAITYALSWSYWGAMALRGDVVTPGGSVSHLPGLFGPMIAAFVVTALASGRTGVADLVGRMFRWRVGLRWYAAALLPFALFLAGVLVQSVATGSDPGFDGLARYSGIPEVGLPAVVLLAFVANGFGEEVGWRGFAQPTLRRRWGLVRACLGVGLAWAIWHVPSFAVIETYRQLGLGLVPVFVVGLGSGAIVFGWLYERAGSSILIVALAHFALNMGSATSAGRGLPQMFVTAGIVVWAALIVVLEQRRLSPSRGFLARVRDGGLVRILRSPLGHRLGRRLTLVEVTGRRSGRVHVTPVEYVRDGGRLIVRVGHPERKQWWRNAAADPHVRVLIAGTMRPGRARVVEEAAVAAGHPSPVTVVIEVEHDAAS